MLEPRPGGRGPHSPAKRRLAETKRRLEEANTRIAELEGDIEGLARVVNVLSVENEALRDQIGDGQPSNIVVLPSVRDQSPA